MTTRMGASLEVPPTRQRWVGDGEGLDVGDRVLQAVRPPIFDSPTTRGLYDPTTGVYWSSDSFATPMPHPMATIAELDDEFWLGGMTTFNNYVSPWLDLVDDAKFQATVDRIEALQPTTLVGCHTPADQRHPGGQGHRQHPPLPRRHVRPRARPDDPRAHPSHLRRGRRLGRSGQPKGDKPCPPIPAGAWRWPSLLIAALTFGAAAPVSASRAPKRPAFLLESTATWRTHDVGWYEVVNGPAEVHLGRRTAHRRAGRHHPARRSHHAGRRRVRARHRLRVRGGRGPPGQQFLSSAGEICGHYVQVPDSIVIQSYRTATIEESGHRGLVGKTAFLDVRLAEDGGAYVFATT